MGNYHEVSDYHCPDGTKDAHCLELDKAWLTGYNKAKKRVDRLESIIREVYHLMGKGDDNEAFHKLYETVNGSTI